MEIGNYGDYRAYLRFRLAHEASRGAMSRLAKDVRVHTTTLSQILNGMRDFSADQAIAVADVLGLSELETDYFLVLVEQSRADSPRLKKFYEVRLDEIRKKSRNLDHVLSQDKVLLPEQRAVFYSQWYYPAIAVLCSLENFQTVSTIADRLRLPPALVARAVKFLNSTGVCEIQSGRIQPAATYTHLDARDPLTARQHGNWRVKAMERHPSMNERELSYTSPLSISRANAERVRKGILKLIAEVNSLSRSSETCEEAYCLNVDWFRF